MEPVAQALWRLARKIIIQQTFGGSTADEALAIGVLEMHNAEVERTIPAERLLVYEVSQGWQRLCRFLGLPVPAGPFPKTNTTDEFVGRLVG